MIHIRNILKKFWFEQPALLYGLAFLLGLYCALQWNAILLLPLILLIVPLGFQLRSFLALAFFLGAFFFANIYYQFPILPAEGTSGQAYVEISSLSSTSTSFGKRWTYRGKIHLFKSNDIEARNIPFSLSLPKNDQILRPSADRAYQIQGLLKEVSPGRYTLVVDKSAPWQPIEGSWSLAESRFQAKQVVTRYIHQHIKGKRTAAFLAGIATGDFDDRAMQLEFARFGLQHIMAISGFHFAIVAGILSLMLRLALNRNRATLVLILILSSYFVFLGCGPSIMRAWAMALITLFGFLIRKRGSGLNSLGIALLIVLFLDPLQCLSLGFQFSFVTTAAILLLFGVVDFAMQSVFIKRSLSQMIEMNLWNQHAYCILCLFRQALALTIAVNSIALPLMLFYFQQFPILSLLYNLFFPFMVSLSMLLLLLGLLFSWVIPPLGEALNALNSHYTHFVLSFTYNMPMHLDIFWKVNAMSLELLICYLSVVFTAGIVGKHWLKQHKSNSEDFAFI